MPVAKRRKVGNLLALALLSLLAQQPMYPYEMAQTLRARGKDKNFKINWGSLYTVVENLEKHGFIEAALMDREGRQPERTTYEITGSGRAELADWLSELLRDPEDEQGGFVTALSEAGILPPDQVIGLLTTRLATLDEKNATHRADLRLWTERLPRALLIESEYQLASVGGVGVGVGELDVDTQRAHVVGGQMQRTSVHCFSRQHSKANTVVAQHFFNATCGVSGFRAPGVDHEQDGALKRHCGPASTAAWTAQCNSSAENPRSVWARSHRKYSTLPDGPGSGLAVTPTVCHPNSSAQRATARIEPARSS